ncbi:MAG: hypothetical protein N3D19_03800 [Archaeoglobaceae archaeon]|nr:hypothetical protein [Archaeoglobaceae archaeon]
MCYIAQQCTLILVCCAELEEMGKEGYCKNYDLECALNYTLSDLGLLQNLKVMNVQKLHEKFLIDKNVLQPKASLSPIVQIKGKNVQF